MSDDELPRRAGDPSAREPESLVGLPAPDPDTVRRLLALLSAAPEAAATEAGRTENPALQDTKTTPST